MQDEEIVRMLFERNEQALIQVETKYGHRMKNLLQIFLIILKTVKNAIMKRF